MGLYGDEGGGRADQRRPPDAPLKTRSVRAAAAAVTLALAAPGAHGQGARVIVVAPDAALETGPDTLPLVEPHVAVDPEDPRHLVVGVIAAAPDRAGPWHCAALASFDGGGEWVRHDLPMRRCIDPWVVFTGRGVLLTAIEILDDGEGGERFRLLAFRSSDGGRSWGPPRALGRSYDHQLVTADPAAADRVILASRRMRTTEAGAVRHALYLGRSEDAGETFRDWLEWAPSNLAANATGLVHDGRGGLVLSYWNFQRNVGGFGQRGMLTRGLAWAVRIDPQNGARSEPFLITDACASGVEGAFPGYPFLAAGGGDPAGSRPGAETGELVRLYHACVAPGLDGINLVASADGGETWTDPVRLAETPPGQGHARTPMLAVNGAGAVGVAWYDRSEDDARVCQHTWFAGSADGGVTFAAPVRVSTSVSCPRTTQNGRVAESWPMGGDYGSLAAAGDGTFRLLWSDSRSGRFALRSAILRVEPAEATGGR